MSNPINMSIQSEIDDRHAILDDSITGGRIKYDVPTPEMRELMRTMIQEELNKLLCLGYQNPNPLKNE